MQPRTIARAWTTAGMLTLPVYAILLAVGTWSPQPDQITDPEAWARFVASPSYLISHLLTGVVGAALVILGTFALAALITHRAPRLAPTGLVLTTVGQVLFTVPAVISTFATPAIGQGYLRGNREVMTVAFPEAMTAVTMFAVLLTVAGNVVLGVVIARTRVFPRWTGIVWATATVVFYILGAALGMVTTGASLPTQPAGAALLAISSAVMAWSAARHYQDQPAAESPVSTPTASARS
jgi:hypothetical protein